MGILAAIFTPTCGLIESPFIIPIFGIIFGCGIAIVAVYTEFQRKKAMFSLYHQERMAAIEKGIELPPVPEAFTGEESGLASPRRNLLKGLIWFFIGLGMIGAFRRMNDEVSLLGLIPAGIGLAYLIYYAVAGRKEIELYEAQLKARLAEKNRPASL